MARRKVVALPAQVANQIAAGEVVTRPASVVKELVENAIDAEARRVVVDVEGGGTTRLTVSDDGHGMDREDAQLALERHATSKIRAAEDLVAIQSFGFRGEALPSIASVSRLTLRTRPPELDEGTEVTVEGGAAMRVSPCGCAPGTTITVADLFYNVPARRKFLRAVATEAAHVGEVVRCLALAHPGVGFELSRDGRRSRRFLPTSSRLERAREVLEGYELFGCEGERGPARVEAYLSGADRARTGAGGLYLFVLDRAVQDRALARAVASAYGDALEPGRYPVGAVFIELPRELVDVNVHPQKAEVRFAHARAVADAVHGVVRDAFGTQTRRREPAAAWRSGGRDAEPWQWREPTGARHGLETSPERGAPSGAPDARRPPVAASPIPGPSVAGPRAAGEITVVGGSIRGGTREMSRDPAEARSGGEALDEGPGRPPEVAGARSRLVGVVRGALLCETRRGLVVVPRRRARAQLAALRARRELSGGRLASQRLLFPLVRSLDEATCDALEGEPARAARWGVELRRVGPTSLAFHAVPRLFAPAAHEALVSALVAALTSADEEGALERLAALVTDTGDDDGRLLDALAAEGVLEAAASRVFGFRELGLDD